MAKEQKHRPTTRSLERAEKVVAKIPKYPGRAAAEAAVRPVVEPWARHTSAQVIMRLVGYWAVWSVTPGGRAEIIDRGLMSRSRAFGTEADFRKMFGVGVAEFDLSMLAKFIGTEPTETEPEG